ncbi:hypothetical protein [Actinomadura sp. 6N118]|uniref:hypothetical protein n=1 Tax=Actinomadura sp. 6N118 TaxID=3375151 RepID=UPI00378DF5A2
MARGHVQRYEKFRETWVWYGKDHVRICAPPQATLGLSSGLHPHEPVVLPHDGLDAAGAVRSAAARAAAPKLPD